MVSFFLSRQEECQAPKPPKGGGLVPLPDQSPGCWHSGAVHEKRSKTHLWLTGPGHSSASSVLNTPGGQSECIEHRAACELGRGPLHLPEREALPP